MAPQLRFVQDRWVSLCDAFKHPKQQDLEISLTDVFIIQNSKFNPWGLLCFTTLLKRLGVFWVPLADVRYEVKPENFMDPHNQKASGILSQYAKSDLWVIMFG